MRTSLVVVLGLVAACGNANSQGTRGAECPCACASSSAQAATSSSAQAAPSSSAQSAPSSSVTPTAPLSESDVAKIIRAGEHAQSASRRLAWHDGAGCLAELDEHDALDTRPSQASTSTDSYLSLLRAECTMLAGKCDEGRQLYRKAFAAMQGKSGSPEQTEKVTDAIVGMYCHGTNLSPRDQVLAARMEMQSGAWMTTKTPAQCTAAYQTIWKYRTTVVPRDDDDTLVKDPLGFLYAAAPNCFARAGDCAGAWRVFQDVTNEKFKGQPWIGKPDVVRKSFEAIVPKCKAPQP